MIESVLFLLGGAFLLLAYHDADPRLGVHTPKGMQQVAVGTIFILAAVVLLLGRWILG